MRTVTTYSIFLLLFLAGCVSQRPASVRTMSDIPYPYPVKTIDLDDGIRIAYMEEGKGDQTLLFIHGLGSYAPAWKKNIEGLKNEFHCIAVDLPGYGHSSKGDYPGDMVFYADVIAQLIQKLGLGKRLGGHVIGKWFR